MIARAETDVIEHSLKRDQEGERQRKRKKTDSF